MQSQSESHRQGPTSGLVAGSLAELEAEARRMRAIYVAGLLRRGFAALRQRLASRWVRLTTYRDLITLDDRMLQDIGLHRAELPYVAEATARGEAVPANRNRRSTAA